MAFIFDDDGSPTQMDSACGHCSDLDDHPRSPQCLITAITSDSSIIAQSLLLLECGCLRCPEHLPGRNSLMPSCELPACNNTQHTSGESLAPAVPQTGNTQVAQEIPASEGEYRALRLILGSKLTRDHRCFGGQHWERSRWCRTATPDK